MLANTEKSQVPYFAMAIGQKYSLKNEMANCSVGLSW
jgi:hypothetical protein